MSDGVVENFEKMTFVFNGGKFFSGGYFIGQGTRGCHGTRLSTGGFFKLQTVPACSERTDSSMFLMKE